MQQDRIILNDAVLLFLVIGMYENEDYDGMVTEASGDASLRISK